MDMHVTDVLGCSLDENLKICADSIEYLKKHGIETIFDASISLMATRTTAIPMKVLVAARSGRQCTCPL